VTIDERLQKCNQSWTWIAGSGEIRDTPFDL
jgi:hypothetical protein